jgi:hypothetical protein
VELHTIDATAPVQDCVAFGERLADSAGRVGMLVMGDGSACRGPGAPGYDDPAAEPFDAAAADALGKADAQALRAIDPALAERLRVTGRAPWQVLAGATAAATASLTDAELLHHEAPYGVAYLVASWR